MRSDMENDFIIKKIYPSEDHNHANLCLTVKNGELIMDTCQNGAYYTIVQDRNGNVIYKPTYNSPETMPKEAGTYLYVEDGNVRLATYKDGNRINDISILKSISDVRVLNERVVMVTFSDGNTEKAVLDAYDSFNIEQGIAICIMKKIFSKISNGNGSSVYNKLVEYGLKTYNDIWIAKLREKTEKDKRDTIAKKNADRAKHKRERKAAEKREYEIEIQKEAYLRAMREFNDTSNTVVAK